MTTFRAFVILILCIVETHCDQYVEEPSPVSDGECCKTIINDEQYQCLRRGYSQWQLLRQSDNKEHFFKTHDMCVSNCVFNVTNILTPDNKVNSNELKNVMEKIFGTEWQSQLTNMMEVCKERVDNEKPREAYKFSFNCSIPAETLFSCLQEQKISLCPDSLWNNTPACNNMRTFIKRKTLLQ